jgi:hypothetical protein
MKRTREDLKSRKERLNWEIRFGPTNGATKEEIMELEKERTYVIRRLKVLEGNKGTIQRRCERMRGAITGILTTSSREDPEEWGTHTPTPTARESEEEEESEEAESD